MRDPGALDGTSTNPFEEGRSTGKLRFPPQEAYGE